MASQTMDTSPPIHRLQPDQEFDPSLFTRSIQVLAASIDASKTTAMTKTDPMKGRVVIHHIAVPFRYSQSATRRQVSIKYSQSQNSGL